MSATSNGASDADKGRIPPEAVEKIAQMRSQVRESFGKIVLTLMGLPRYRHQTIADLNHLVLDPLIRDRIALAHPADQDRAALIDITGLAIWASVSDEVDAKIREQIKAGVFPIRLKQEDWTSGSNNWLLDIIAPDRKATGQVLANFGRVVKGGNLRLHPVVAGLVDEETLKKLRNDPAEADA